MRTRSRICSLVSASFSLWSGLSGPIDCIPVHVKNPKTDVFDEIHLLSQLVFILCFFFGNGGSRIAAVIYNCWDASEALALSWRHLLYCSQFRFFCFSRGDATLYSTGDAIRRERDGLTCSSFSNNESQPLQRCNTFFLVPPFANSSSSYTTPGSCQTGKRRTHSENKEKRNN